MNMPRTKRCPYCNRQVRTGIGDFKFKQHTQDCYVNYQKKKKTPQKTPRQYNKILMNWNHNNKVVLRNPGNQSFFNHELIKQAIVHMLRDCHSWRVYKKHPVYTEHKIDNRIADVYTETKEGNKIVKYAFEIQKEITPTWQKKVEEFYLDRDITPIIIPEKKVIEDLQMEIRENHKKGRAFNPIYDLIVIISRL